jgi:LysM repeat protein
VGQVLVIPAGSNSGGSNGGGSNSGVVTHTVVSGDTLFSLARRYGTTVSAIMQRNHLPNANIYIGQTLLIPTSGTIPGGNGIYVVVSGDTLYSIARRYSTTAPALMAANGLASPLIYIGQRLIVPATVTPIPVTPIPVTPLPITLTPTPTGSLTPTATTPTPTGSLTPTATGSVSPTPTPSLTPSVTPTPSPTFSPTPTFTPTPTAT